MERYATMNKREQVGHIVAMCPGILLFAYESFISVPMYKSSCRLWPAAVMSLAS